jgi:(2Fe-2S) ferredoxin
MARGSLFLHDRSKESMEARGPAKTEVRACTSICLDACWAGPAIAVEPDHYFHGRVTEADVPEIVAALATGPRVQRLVLALEDFIEPKELRRAYRP